MESKCAQAVIRNRLGISLSEKQSRELYTQLCYFLLAKDEFAYINILKTKCALLLDGVSLPECDYQIMEILLDGVEIEDALALASTVYLVKHKP